MDWYKASGFAPYVRVAERRKQAVRKIAELRKKGQVIQPILLEGRVIAKTFWGKAWCNHLESYSDYENRLPRGRSYVRNGSVIDLQIYKGEIKALVNGSAIYKVKVSVLPISANKWNILVKECAGKIDSLIELLLGKLSSSVMEVITHPEKGLFPHPKEIKLSCSCPDWAALCKHVAAVLYGVGAHLDAHPEALFLLRQVEHSELISKVETSLLVKQSKIQGAEIIKSDDLSTIFGIEMEESAQVATKKHDSKEQALPLRRKSLKNKPVKDTEIKSVVRKTDNHKSKYKDLSFSKKVKSKKVEDKKIH